MSNPPAVRITVAYDDDPGGAAEALLAVLRAASRPLPQISQQHELDLASPATTPLVEEALHTHE